MEFARLTVEELELTLVEPFETSFGVERRRRFGLARIDTTDGRSGWGECVAVRDPLYSEETIGGARSFYRESIVPRWRHAPPTDLASLQALLRPFRGNRMAKAALEQAVADLSAQADHQPLGRWLGGRRSSVEVGVSVGIHPSVDALVDRVGRYLEDGYHRIKLKVRPGWDRVPVIAVRREFPDAELWVDANQAYPAGAATSIRTWAHRAEVAQVEQPFAERALAAHAELVKGAHFRVCLDESVVDMASLDEAISARALTCLNVKPGRVGGPIEAKELARHVRRRSFAAWVGGMLESGVGRAHSVHVATLPEFNLPGDISANRRYYAEDLVVRPFELRSGSRLDVPRGPGLGIEFDERVHRRALRHRGVYRLTGAR